MRFDRLCKTFIAPCIFAGASQLLPAPALSQTAAQPSDQALRLFQNALHLAQYRECRQRVGPFATQTTAWQRWQEAQGQGYSVSNGVVPCYEGGTRGYCFFAFYRC
jgi:hypothetical protein